MKFSFALAFAALAVAVMADTEKCIPRPTDVSSAPEVTDTAVPTYESSAESSAEESSVESSAEES
ncbi:hypothetical protein LPJ62_001419, partial [Coemansia sp. RSA 2167]